MFSIGFLGFSRVSWCFLGFSKGFLEFSEVFLNVSRVF